MSKLLYVYITNPDLKTARRMANLLLDRKLIACANIFPPSESIYPWKGKRVREKEVVLIGKTTARAYGAIKKVVKENHPYTTPCIVSIPISANAEYEQWLLKNLSERPRK